MIRSDKCFSRRSFVSGAAAAVLFPALLISSKSVRAQTVHARGAKVPAGLRNRMRRQNLAARSLDARIGADSALKGLLAEPKPLTSAPPAKFDWRDSNHVTPVRDQGTCGSCWIFAALAAYESAHLIANSGIDASKLEVSEQQLLDCTFAETNCVVGGWHEVVFTYLQTLGAVNASQYAYNSANPQRGSYCNANFGLRPYYARNWWYVATDRFIPNVTELKQALMTHGPVACGVSTTKKWDDYTGGVVEAMPSSENPANIDHEVVIVGWDDSLKGDGFPAGAWIVKNSWQPAWGMDGYIHIPYNGDNIGFAASCVSAWPEATPATATAINNQLRATQIDLLKTYPEFQSLR